MFNVAHEQYKRIDVEQIKGMLKNNDSLVYDLKNMFSKDDFEKNGITKIGM